MTKRRISKPSDPHFAAAFRTARLAMKKTQEDFDDISSRTYVSMLERGEAMPTITTVHDLALEMGLHPLTILVLSYAKAPSRKSLESLFEIVVAEVEALAAERLVDVPLRTRKPRVRKSSKESSGLSV